RSTTVHAPANGIVIGHTRNPLVNQGDGIFHLALLDTA
ncbi:MAG TPA: succinylglutamate desuccinylase, partial [Elainellaceae cyanobacterium]